MRDRRRTLPGSLACLAATALAVAAALAATPSGAEGQSGKFQRDGGTGTGFLGECALLRDDDAKLRCYERRLLAEVEASGDPASELPRIDQRARTGEPFLVANCHTLMHEVGRTFAKRRGVTLGTMQRYVPRSNDPGCSAGFGMGMVMHLGPQIARFGGEGADRACLGLATRFRRYTCVHGLGHAYMRVYHGELPDAVAACARLGAREAPDCAQGAFHDYWISLNDADGTRRAADAETSPRTVCARQITAFVRPCWYRFFLERPPARPVDTPAGVVSLCEGLSGLQRSGCLSGAALIVSGDPFEQTRICSRLPATEPIAVLPGAARPFAHLLRGFGVAMPGVGELDGYSLAADVVDCLRAVVVQGVAARRKDQLDLIRMCATMPPDARRGCYEWFGKTLAVVTNGAFAEGGCAILREEDAWVSCRAGARDMNEALVTFS